jgi:hypothetical protein
MVLEAALPGAVEAVAAGLADGLTAAAVLVVGSDVPDRFVQPNRIVFSSHSFQFGFQDDGVGEGLQVRPLALDVAEE